jgi:DNA-binding MarR family transcriptional regulator
LSPHIPGELAKDFRRNKINHADLNGRLYLRSATLIIDKDPQNPIYRGPAPNTDWFSRKSSRILRSLLSHPDQEWTQKELIQSSGVSGGLVSRIVTALDEERFIEKRYEAQKGSPARYRLKDGERLLDRWQAEDNWNKRVRVEQYSLLQDNAEAIARTAQEELGAENLAFTQWFAANLRYAYTTTPVVSAYIREERLHKFPFGRRVEEGGNLWLIVPEDEGIFLETRIHKGFCVVSDIQIYLDLIHVGLRGPDHAEELRKWEGFNR